MIPKPEERGQLWSELARSTSWLTAAGRYGRGPLLRIGRLTRFTNLMVGGTLLIIFIGLAVGAELVRPYKMAITIDLLNQLLPPSAAHPFGTDEFGRDILARVIYGSQSTVIVASVAVGLATVIGLPLGFAVGFLGGWPDALVGRILDAFFAFPIVLLAILIVTVIGPGEVSSMIAIGLAAVPQTTRVARAAVIGEKSNEYVEASRALGSSTIFTIARGILPNLRGPILVLTSLGLAYAALDSSALAYLGLGAQPPRPAWGSMLAGAQGYIVTDPIYALFPGAAIFLFVLALNLIGDGLRDATDPSLVRPR